MPQVIQGPFVIDSFKLTVDDYGDSPIADVVIGHPDGYKIVVHLEHYVFKKPKSSIHVELPKVL